MGIVGLEIREIDKTHYLIARNTIGNANIMGKKITPNTISDVWRNRIGRYRVVEKLDVIDIRHGGIKLSDNFLVAYGKTNRGDTFEIALIPIDDKSALITGIGRGFNERVYVKDTKTGEKLIYSNIEFEKQ